MKNKFVLSWVVFVWGLFIVLYIVFFILENLLRGNLFKKHFYKYSVPEAAYDVKIGLKNISNHWTKATWF